MFIDWYIGQKVVCIDGLWSRKPLEGEVFPSKNVIYTIRDIKILYERKFLQFFELRNPPVPEILEEVAFLYTHFKPIVESNDNSLNWVEDILKSPKGILTEEIRELNYA
jgi:hypothetical protein